jgi:hypothetical protein
MTEETTQDPKGSGQEETVDELKDRLQALETENAGLKDQVHSIDQIARRHQARADRLGAERKPAPVQQARTALGTVGAVGQAGTAQAVQEAEEEAYQARLQTYKLQVMQHLGLTDDDVDPDLELTSADAILNHMNLVSVQKQLGQSQSITIDDVNKAITDALTSAGGGDESEGEPLTSGMGGLIDTGGPSGTIAGERSDKLDKMYQKSEELRRGGDLNQAGYLALRAIYADSDKVVKVREADSGDISDISV